LLPVTTRPGNTASQWNIGARDEALPPLEPIAGRLVRAQANFAETFPIAIVALLGVVLAGRTSDMTALGGWIWLGARVFGVSPDLLGGDQGRADSGVRCRPCSGF
jgi:uncharacterized MAPEG superfamily protein